MFVARKDDVRGLEKASAEHVCKSVILLQEEEDGVGWMTFNEKQSALLLRRVIGVDKGLNAQDIMRGRSGSLTGVRLLPDLLLTLTKEEKLEPIGNIVFSTWLPPGWLWIHRTHVHCEIRVALSHVRVVGNNGRWVARRDPSIGLTLGVCHCEGF